MIFKHLSTLLSRARFVQLDYDEVLLVVSEGFSTPLYICLTHPESPDGFQYVIREEDAEKAVVDGNAIRVNALVSPEETLNDDAPVVRFKAGGYVDNYGLEEVVLTLLDTVVVDVEKALAEL